MGVDRKTVRKYIARGLEPPVYGPRGARPRLIDPYVAYLRERVTAYPGLSGRRLLREIRERGYQGGYTAVADAARDLRPPSEFGYEVRFETPPGDQAQVDFAHFKTVFTDEPGVVRKVCRQRSRVDRARYSATVSISMSPLPLRSRLPDLA